MNTINRMVMENYAFIRWVKQLLLASASPAILSFLLILSSCRVLVMRRLRWWRHWSQRDEFHLGFDALALQHARLDGTLREAYH